MTLVVDRPSAAQPARPASTPVHLRFDLTSCGVLRVEGEIDLATGSALERQATQLLAITSGRLVLDLSAATFLDVAGLRIIERLARRAHALGGRLALVGGAPPVERILGLVPHAWMDVERSLAAAVDVVTASSEVRDGAGASLKNR
jgi:anti-anti-sigma factor